MRLRCFLVVAPLLVVCACTSDVAVITTATPTSTVSTSTSTPSVYSTTTSPAGAEWPAVEVLVTNDDGVFNIDASGAVSQLVEGRVAYAADDTRGGLLFQLERGRSTAWWEGPDHGEVNNTVVWWVPKGAGGAQALLVPTPDANLDLSLVDAVAVDGRTLIVYVRHDSTMDPEYGPHGWHDTLRVFDLDSHRVTELFRYPAYEHDVDFSIGGGAVLVDEADVAGNLCYFLEDTLSGGSVSTVFPNVRPGRGQYGMVLPELVRCDGDECPWGCVLSPDATAAAFMAVDSMSTGAARTVSILEPLSGEVAAEYTTAGVHSVALADGYLLVNRESGPAVVVHWSAPALLETQLPVYGTARFVKSAIDVVAPIRSPDFTPPWPEHPGMPATADRPPLVVAGADGVTLWANGAPEVLVDGPPTRVAYRLATGTVIYQEEGQDDYDRPAPLMRVEPGGEPTVLVGTEGVRPVLWGTGDIDGNPVAVYERWPVPCEGDDSSPCEGRLLAIDPSNGSEVDLGAFSAPAFALGPSGVAGGIVLVYNSGAEIGDIGSFSLLDIGGTALENPVCKLAVDCDRPMRMLGALSPEGERVAYVLDRMKVGTDVEYDFVDRSFGVVDRATGKELLSIELEGEGEVAWLDFDGEHASISVRHDAEMIAYLVGPDGAVEPLTVSGVATLPR